MTIEYCEKRSSIRFARTYFLTPLAKDDNYLKDVNFTSDQDIAKPSD
jgi:hypothetical protein